MSASAANTVVERTEKNKVKLTFAVSPEEFKKGLQFAYNKNKNSISIQGFRKGKAPRNVIERYYGKEYFHDEAINHVLPDAYEQALEEQGLDPVYRPEIQVESVDESTGIVFIAEVYVKPEVTIDGYRGISYKKAEIDPTEEEIEKRLQQEMEKNARTITVDRPARNGDIATINFVGYLKHENGELTPFDGGEGNDYELALGSKTFIDNFEDQLVGHSVGDDVDVHVTFPEEYTKEEFSGKPALFKVEILEIQAKELPELNDEFAQDVSEFDTLAEYRQNILESMKDEKEQQSTIEKQNYIIGQLVKMAVMEVPEAMYTARIDEMIVDLIRRLDYQGIELRQYMLFNNLTEDTLRDSYKTMAKNEVDSSLVLEAIAKKENFEISRQELIEYVEINSKHLKEPAEKFIDSLSYRRKLDLEQDLLIQKALDFVEVNAVAVDFIVDDEISEE